MLATLWLMGHQCSLRQPWFESFDKEEDTVLLVEEHSKKLWKGYHKQKLVLIFSIMRHFKEELEKKGYKVDYRTADTFSEGLDKHVNQYRPNELYLHEPTDYHRLQDVRKWVKAQKDTDVHTTEEGGFLIGRDEWESLLPDNENWQMDKLYRKFRKDMDVLLTKQKKPIGGKWSYDADNRKKPKKDMEFPNPDWPKPDQITKDVIQEVEKNFPDTYGTLETFHYPVTADAAEAFLEDFMKNRLELFGDYQDAMIPGDPFMAHSLLSTSINNALLDPLDVVRRAEQAYHDEQAPLNAVEGFIRQIIGWREYIRGIYIRKMPDYENTNELNHKRDLPDFYWTADTEMNCLKECTSAVVDHGYSHHIQRLMVLGNFANLAGIEPKQVSDWFNEMYVDAHDWVVLPNVLGMALYADGGLMSTKPYVSSGNYIQKMSRYCGDCRYSVKEKYGEDACPFHALYWDFLERHEDRFRSNQRMGMIYKHVDNRSEEDTKQQKDTVKLNMKRMEEGTL
ncbi:cryptochrome/photolyase family protein [Bacillus daqingensis]|uniref:Cryptochrome/photolyase family protein n=1 Tax=Bacillus daqingensis TaxID=872396 RepID=A0ABV9NU54_9BACI